MSGNKEISHATKISHQIHKNISSTYQRGTDTKIQHVAPVPVRGYITYSSQEIRDHRGDGQWQTQTRYDYPTDEIMARDHRASDYYAQPKPSHNFHSFPNQGTPNSRDDPLFDEFLNSLMESFEGNDKPNFIGYQTEFSSPVGYNVPNYSDKSSYRTVSTNPPQVHDLFSRPDSPPSRRGTTSYPPEYGAWPPGPRDSTTRYHQMDEKRHFGPSFPTKQTQNRYPLTSNAHSETEWKHLEIFPRQNSQYRDHQYGPPAPTNQMQLPSTQQQKNLVRPGDGYSQTEEDDSTWKTSNVGYKYPAALPQRNMPRPEREIGWEVKDNRQPKIGGTISNMGMGTLNYGKKNLHPGPALPENGNTGPDSTNHWQISNQPNSREKSSNTQENGNTRPEFSMNSSQGKTNALPETAHRWLTKQLSSREKYSHDETPDPEFSAPVSQQNGNPHPDLANHSGTNPNTGAPNSPMKSKFSMPFSKEKLNSFSRNPGVPQEKGSARPEIVNQPDVSNQTNNGDGNSRGGTLDSPRQRLSAPDQQETGYAVPEASNVSEIRKQPNISEKLSKLRALDSPRQSQVEPDSQERGNYGTEASNGSEISKQPNIKEKFSKFGALNSPRKNQFPALFSKEK